MTSGQLEYVDSHTEGEPTRMVVSGFPDLGPGNPQQKLAALRTNFDWIRTSLILEPRGCRWLVGALVSEPSSNGAAADVIFFNNTGYLGMCGHGLIGVVKSLGYLNRIEPGIHRFGTPVGLVTAELRSDGRVSVENVVSYRYQSSVPVPLENNATCTGDIAWGGNWFFLTEVPRIAEAEIPQLMEYARSIRRALDSNQLTGRDRGLIDHVELYCETGERAGRNFVLCPGEEYDRSPCGTGTSAKLACLAADGKLEEGEVWTQTSVIGSRFEARYRRTDRGIVPTITGRAFVTAHATCVFEESDPFRYGIGE